MCENNNCESLPSRTLCFRHEQLCKPVLGNPLLSVEAYSASAEQRVVNIKDPQLKIFSIPFSTKYIYTSDNRFFLLTNVKQRCNKCLLGTSLLPFCRLFTLLLLFSFYVTKYFCCGDKNLCQR